MNKNKISSLQSIRALAFLGILCQHCSIIRLGTWGVTVFFVLSGFVLVFSSYDKQYDISLKTQFLFALSKIKKLYPIHLLTTFASFILALYGYIISEQMEEIKYLVGKLFLHILLIQSWFSETKIINSLNGVDWFLSAILFLYFIFPLLHRIIKSYPNRDSAKKAIFISILLQIIISYLLKNTKNVYYYTYFFPPYRIFEFWLGMNLGYLRITKEINNEKTAMWGEIISLLLLFFSLDVYFKYSIDYLPTWIENSLLFIPSTLGIIYFVSLESGMVSKCINNKFLVWIGNLSGYTFLLHETVLVYFQAVYYKITGIIIENYVLQVIIVFGISMLCAQLYTDIKIRLNTSMEGAVLNGILSRIKCKNCRY